MISESRSRINGWSSTSKTRRRCAIREGWVKIEFIGPPEAASRHHHPSEDPPAQVGHAVPRAPPPAQNVCRFSLEISVSLRLKQRRRNAAGNPRPGSGCQLDAEMGADVARPVLHYVQAHTLRILQSGFGNANAIILDFQLQLPFLGGQVYRDGFGSAVSQRVIYRFLGNSIQLGSKRLSFGKP